MLRFTPTPPWCHQPLAGAHRSSKGYSLTELIAAVAIIAIMAGLALHSFTNRARAEKLKTGTQSMAAWLDGVRQLAIQQSETCAIRVSGSGGTLQLEPYGSQTTACPSNTPRFDLKAASGATGVVLCAAAQGPTTAAPGCGSGSGNLQLLFTPRGTSTTDALLQTRLEGVSPNRCIQLIAPLGLLRIGRVAGSNCDWNKAS